MVEACAGYRTHRLQDCGRGLWASVSIATRTLTVFADAPPGLQSCGLDVGRRKPKAWLALDGTIEREGEGVKSGQMLDKPMQVAACAHEFTHETIPQYGCEVKTAQPTL